MTTHGPTQGQYARLKDDYIYPAIEIIFESVKTQPNAKALLERIVTLVTSDNAISASSETLAYGEVDVDLKANLKRELPLINEKDIDDIYHSAYQMLHQFYLNKEPVTEQEKEQNRAVLADLQRDEDTVVQLFERTAQVADTIGRRLSRFGPELSNQQIKELVAKVARDSVKIADTVAPTVESVTPSSSPTYSGVLPQFQALFMKQKLLREKEQQEEADRALAELMAREMQEEDDRVFAERVQRENSGNDEEDQEEGSEQEADQEPNQDANSDLSESSSSSNSERRRRNV